MAEVIQQWGQVLEVPRSCQQLMVISQTSKTENNFIGEYSKWKRFLVCDVKRLLPRFYNPREQENKRTIFSYPREQENHIFQPSRTREQYFPTLENVTQFENKKQENHVKMEVEALSSEVVTSTGKKLFRAIYRHCQNRSQGDNLR